VPTDTPSLAEQREALTRSPDEGRRDRAEPLARPTRVAHTLGEPSPGASPNVGGTRKKR
jgi:hypothetical protein